MYVIWAYCCKVIIGSYDVHFILADPSNLHTADPSSKTSNLHFVYIFHAWYFYYVKLLCKILLLKLSFVKWFNSNWPWTQEYFPNALMFLQISFDQNCCEYGPPTLKIIVLILKPAYFATAYVDVSRVIYHVVMLCTM